MSNLTGQGGTLHFTVQIKRAATGEQETYELTGTITEDQAKALGLTDMQPTAKEQDHGSHP